MEKEYGKIKKNDTTDIVVRADDFGGKVGLTIREFTTSERYTGFTKSGTRIPLGYFDEFKEIIKKINKGDLETMQTEIPQDSQEPSDDNTNDKSTDPEQKTLNEKEPDEENNKEDEIKEEFF